MKRSFKSNEYPIHFVTTNVKDNIFLFSRPEYCRIIIENLEFYRKKYGLKLYAWVLIPWHIHLLLELLEGVKIQNIMRDFKSFAAKQIIEQLARDGRNDLLQKFLVSKTGDLAGTLAPASRLSPPARAGGLTESAEPDVRSVVRTAEPGGLAGALAPAQLPPVNPIEANKQLGVISLSEKERYLKSKQMNQHRTQPKFQVFQEDFYDFNICNDKKFLQKINYIEVRNPIKHRLVKSEDELEKFRWSSYRCRHIGDDSLIKIDYPETLEF